MAKIRLRRLRKTSPLAKTTFTLSIQTVGNSQTDLAVDSFLPGFAFQIVAVQHFAEAVTATADYNVTCGGRSAVNNQVPTAATRAAATLSTTAANLLGTNAEAVVLQATTDGSGAFTGLKVRVTIVPQGTAP
jgi:hypothetical protein